ncbi:hypothetical protein BDF19DRAFT_422922 [Syncephalis fuscata]|nr:hypothetical protein BDF19DRAFT_422922 [Syncephalis fuscata]
MADTNAAPSMTNAKPAVAAAAITTSNTTTPAATGPATGAVRASRHTRVHSSDRRLSAGFTGAPAAVANAVAGAATAAATANKKKGRSHRQQRPTSKRYNSAHAAFYRSDPERRVGSKDVFSSETEAAEGSWTQDEDENTTITNGTGGLRRHNVGRVVEVIEISESYEDTDDTDDKSTKAQVDTVDATPTINYQEKTTNNESVQNESKRAMPSNKAATGKTPIHENPANSRENGRSGPRRHSTDNIAPASRSSMARTNSETTAVDESNGLMRRATTTDRRRQSVMSMSGATRLPFHHFHDKGASHAAPISSIAPVTSQVTATPEKSKSGSLRGAAGVLRSQPRATTPRHAYPTSPFSRSPPHHGDTSTTSADGYQIGNPVQRAGFTSKFIVHRAPSYNSLSAGSLSSLNNMMNNNAKGNTRTNGRSEAHRLSYMSDSGAATPTVPTSTSSPSPPSRPSTAVTDKSAPANMATTAPNANTNPTVSRTQHKLLLQRQHFLAEDEQYLLHPRNQLRLTKELERVRRSLVGVRRNGDNPILQSLSRVSAVRRQQQQRQLDEATFAKIDDRKMNARLGATSDGKHNSHGHTGLMGRRAHTHTASGINSTSNAATVVANTNH